MSGLRISAGVTVLVVCTVASDAVAQNPKPPTPLPPGIQSVDQLPKDAVVLWIDGQDLTVYADSTSNPEDQDKITTLEIRWEVRVPDSWKKTAIAKTSLSVTGANSVASRSGSRRSGPGDLGRRTVSDT